LYLLCSGGGGGEFIKQEMSLGEGGDGHCDAVKFDDYSVVRRWKGRDGSAMLVLVAPLAQEQAVA